jgi:hypothetical protein
LTASLSATSGSAVTRVMRSWFLRWISTGPVWFRIVSRFFAWQHLAGRGGDEHVVDVVDVLAVLLAEPDDDRVLVALLAEERGLRAGDVGPDGVGDVRDRQAEQRRLRPIDVDGQLGPPLLAADARVADPGTPSMSSLAVCEIWRASPDRRRGSRGSAGCRRRPSAGSSGGCRPRRAC